MAKWSGLYLHGFLSSENSEKGQWFLEKVKAQLVLQESSKANHGKQHMLKTPDWGGFLPITYPMQNVKQSVEVIETALQKLIQLPNNKVFLMGSSMGGFYAQYFGQKYKLPYIMINPALNIDELFQANLGEHVNPLTEVKVQVDKAYTQQLSLFRVDKPNYAIPSLLLIDKDDEVIDVDYCLNQYSSVHLQHRASKTVVYNGGDHRFIHLDEAWQEVNEFLNAC